MIKYGITHVHTEHSFNDSGMEIKELINRAKELGSPAIAISEHGVTTSFYEFMDQCIANDIQGVPGVEAYVTDDKYEHLKKRAHIVFYPTDKIGVRQIYKALTEGNRRALAEDEDNTITGAVNFDIIRKYLGADENGNHHIACTTACVGGVLSSTLLYNQNFNEKIEKQMDKMNEIIDYAPEYSENLEQIEEYERQVKILATKKSELKKIAEKTWKRESVSLKKKTGEDLKIAIIDLNQKKEESENARKELLIIKEELESYKISISNKKKENIKLSKFVEKRKKISDKIEQFEKEKTPAVVLVQEAKDILAELKDIFGDYLYVEIQYHMIPNEKYSMPVIVQMAKKYNVPLIMANDVHIATNSNDDRFKRQFMRSLRFNKWEPEMIGDSELYIKTDEEMKYIFSKIFDNETIEASMNGIKDLFEKCKSLMDEWKNKEEHYPVYEKGADANALLLKMCQDGLKKRFPYVAQVYENGMYVDKQIQFSKKYQERFAHEYKVITKMGYADYHLIVQDFINEGKRLGTDNEDNVGVGIGPGRGSAAGSLICYLLGITDIDPLMYDLLFERFLNEDRVSMPDIDTDIATSIRPKLIKYTQDKYGNNATCGIMTQGTQAARSAILNAARLIGEKLNQTDFYYELARKINKEIKFGPNIFLRDVVNDKENIDECTNIKTVIPGLYTIFKNDSACTEIIKEALIVEGTLTNYGMHAAGIIISDNDDVSDYVTLMYNKEKEQWVCECDKVQAEDCIGTLKMDYLGLNTLDIITDTMKLIKRNYGISLTTKDMKFEKEVFENIFDNGMSTAVFQFESAGMKQMLKQFHPDSFEDLILLVAAYRPGPMAFIPEIINVKTGKSKPDYVIPEMASVLDITYGYPIYQEQIMQIFNKFAGFTLAEADNVRRYMSKKKVEKFMTYKEPFIEGLIKAGGKKEKAEAFWESLISFSKYAFNKSHSCAYAYVSYLTAWLKHHYPLEFITANLNNQKFEKFPILFSDCKTYNIEILRPDINKSDFEFSTENGNIRYGLGKVKGVANAAIPVLKERKNGNYLNISDYVIRTSCDKTATENILQSGGFDSFCDGNRTSVFNELSIIFNLKKKLKEVIKKNAGYDDDSNMKHISELAIENITDEIASITFDENAVEMQKEKYLKEKELLNTFVTGHPITAYQKQAGCVDINKVVGNHKFSIMGLITDLRIVGRKKDGAKMAFFKVEDLTGEIPVTCFTDSYSKYNNIIEEGYVIKIDGVIREQATFNSDDTELVINLEEAKLMKESSNEMIVQVQNPSILSDQTKMNGLLRFKVEEGGHPLVYSILSQNGQLIPAGFHISDDFMGLPDFKIN